MATSVLVNENGQVSLTCDLQSEAKPVCVNYNPSKKVITLKFSDGSETDLSSTVIPEIGKRLEAVRSVLLHQIHLTGEGKEFEIPLNVLFDDIIKE